MSLPVDRSFDARPRWTSVGSASALVVDEGRGRLFAIGNRIEALRLDDGSPAVTFERSPWPGSFADVHFTKAMDRAISLLRGEIVQWDTSTGKCLSRVPTEHTLGMLEATDPAGRRGLLLVGEPGMIRFIAQDARILLIDLETGEELGEVTAQMTPTMQRTGVFLDDGTIVLANRNGRVTVHDVSGALLRTIEPPPLGPDDSEISLVGVRNVGGTRVVLTEMMSTSALDIVTGERPWKVNGSPLGSGVGGIQDLRLVVRQFLPTYGFNSAFQEIDLTTGKTSPIYAFSWQNASSGPTVTAGVDAVGNIQLAAPDLTPIDLRRPFDRMPASATAIGLRADGTVIIGCEDTSIRRISDGAMSALPSHGTIRIASARFLPDGRRAVTLAADGHRAWRTDGWTLECETIFQATNADPISSPNGEHFMGIRSPSLTLRSGIDGSVLREVVLQGGPMSYDASLALLDGGQHAVGQSANDVVRWNLATGEPDARLNATAQFGDTFSGLLAVAEPGGRRVLLYSSYAEGMLLWDPDAGEPRLLPEILDATRVVFADARRAIVVARRPIDGPSSGWMDRILVISLADGAVLGEMTAHQAEITAIAVAGDRVVSADAARQIAFWRLPPAVS